MKSIALAFGAMTLAGAAAVFAAPADAPKKTADVSIPFVSHGGVRDWRAFDDHTLYIESQGSQWFKATTMGTCIGLDFADKIGFDGGGNDTFDKFSRLIVRGQPCPIETLVKVDGPPAKKPKPHGKK
jgi:opacity protein-like surface antigen